jgi:hypothetical protein
MEIILVHVMLRACLYTLRLNSHDSLVRCLSGEIGITTETMRSVNAVTVLDVYCWKEKLTLPSCVLPLELAPCSWGNVS